MDPSILENIGLSKAESLIYINLLKLGEATVREIAKSCGFHRTNIYDILEQLKEKGLVVWHQEGKVTIYKASNPENLVAYLKEKEIKLSDLLPDLKRLQKSVEGIEVEVYKGEEGMKSMF